MEIYNIPFKNNYIIYRPLRRLAFIGNKAMITYIQQLNSWKISAPNSKVDNFLEALGFWQPDPQFSDPSPLSFKHLPTIAVLLMTGACNLCCIYCYARGGDKPDLQMGLSLAQSVIDRAYENACVLGQNYFSLAFHGGGEPSMNWKVLTAAVKYAKSKNLPCDISMSSNGIWNKQQLKFIINNFTSLSVSFDGVREIQDHQRPLSDGGSSFAVVIKSIRALDEVNFNYGIRLTAVPENFARLPENIEFLCKEARCRIMQVEPCYTNKRGEYSDPTLEQAEAFSRAFMEAFKIASLSGRTLFYSGARPWILTSTFCKAPENALVVTPEGHIVTCFETYGSQHSLISYFTIGRASSEALEIDAAKFQVFTEIQKERRKACKDCFCYWHCGGDCASRCLSTPSMVRNRCQVNRFITRELLAWYIAESDGVWFGKMTNNLF